MELFRAHHILGWIGLWLEWRHCGPPVQLGSHHLCGPCHPIYFPVSKARSEVHCGAGNLFGGYWHLAEDVYKGGPSLSDPVPPWPAIEWSIRSDCYVLARTYLCSMVPGGWAYPCNITRPGQCAHKYDLIVVVSKHLKLIYNVILPALIAIQLITT